MDVNNPLKMVLIGIDPYLYSCVNKKEWLKQLRQPGTYSLKGLQMFHDVHFRGWIQPARQRRGDASDLPLRFRERIHQSRGKFELKHKKDIKKRQCPWPVATHEFPMKSPCLRRGWEKWTAWSFWSWILQVQTSPKVDTTWQRCVLLTRWKLFANYTSIK